MTSSDEAPIACTLGGHDYRERLAWIARLNRDGLRAHRREAMTLVLRYAAAVRDRVHQLVRQEAECCAFLGFIVTESPDEVSVTITVPERAGGMADDLLAPFLPSVDPRPPQSAGARRPGGSRSPTSWRGSAVESSAADHPAVQACPRLPGVDPSARGTQVVGDSDTRFP